MANLDYLSGVSPGAGGGALPPKADKYTAYYEAYGIDPSSTYAKMARDMIAGGDIAVDEAFDLVADRFNLGPYAPKPESGGSAPAFSGTPAGLRMQADLMEEAANNEFNRTLKLQKIQEAADLRAQAQRIENDLRIEASRRQQEAESELVDLAGSHGSFRFGFARMGQRAPTNTPISNFKSQLQQTANAPIPKFNPNATMDEITNNIRSMEQFTTQQPFRPPGLEKGGKIGQKGAVEPFKFGRPDPHTMIEMADKMGMTAIITGERSGGPELMLAPKGTTVIPLTDDEERELVGELPGAATGGTVSGFGEQIGGSVFKGIGNQFAPRFGTGSDPRYGRLFRSARDALASEGIGGRFKTVGDAFKFALQRPEFAGLTFGTNESAMIRGALNREGGTAEGMSQFAPLQFLRSEAGATGLIQQGLSDAPEGTARYRALAPGFGFTPSPPQGAAYTTPKPGSFTGRIYSPITGELPRVEKIAFSFQQLGLDDKAKVLNAYEIAGISNEEFMSIVNGAGIRGGFRSGVTV